MLRLSISLAFRGTLRVTTITVKFDGLRCGFAVRAAIFAVRSRFTIARRMSAFFIFSHKVLPSG
jgi:hypothetical protein